MDEAAQQSEYLTLDQAAAELDISVDGVRKAIQRGTLKAVRRSPRRRVISRGALEAYKTRGTRPEVPVVSIDELRETFERELGMTAREWQNRWQAGEIQESADSFRWGATSMTILAVEAEIAADEAADGASVTAAKRRPGRPRRVTSRSEPLIFAREN